MFVTLQSKIDSTKKQDYSNIETKADEWQKTLMHSAVLKRYRGGLHARVEEGLAGLCRDEGGYERDGRHPNGTTRRAVGQGR